MPAETIEQKIERGRRATEMLNTDIFKEAFAELSAAAFRTWSKTASDEVETRELCHQQLTAFRQLRDLLQIWADKGTFELMKLKNREERELRGNGSRA